MVISEENMNRSTLAFISIFTVFLVIKNVLVLSYEMLNMVYYDF